MIRLPWPDDPADGDYDMTDAGSPSMVGLITLAVVILIAAGIGGLIGAMH